MQFSIPQIRRPVYHVGRPEYHRTLNFTEKIK